MLRIKPEIDKGFFRSVVMMWDRNASPRPSPRGRGRYSDSVYRILLSDTEINALTESLLPWEKASPDNYRMCVKISFLIMYLLFPPFKED
jgi:hypothetical protein